MKQKSLFLVISIVAVLLMIIPFVLQAQGPDSRIPPLPSYPEYSIDNQVDLPPEKRPTSTPDPEEARRLPTVTPVKPRKYKLIDTAPDIAHGSKYQVVIIRGQTGDKEIVLVAEGFNKEEVLKEHLNQEQEDILLRIDSPPVNRNFQGEK